MNKQSATTILRRAVRLLVLFVAIYLFVTSLPAIIGWENLFGTAGAKTFEQAGIRVMVGIGLLVARAIADQITE